jgi:hypothetical protein
MHTLEKREPQAFGWGIAFFCIGVVLGCVIHWKAIGEALALVRGSQSCPCCLIVTATIAVGAIVLPLLYGAVGFYVGYALHKMFRSE